MMKRFIMAEPMEASRWSHFGAKLGQNDLDDSTLRDAVRGLS
jgi:hypothetical protein